MLNEHLIRQLQYQPEEQQYLKEKFRNRQDSSVIEIEAAAFMEMRQLIAARLHSPLSEGKPHRHNYIELMYVCKGEFIHTIGGEKIAMKTGDFLLMDQNVTHCVSTTTQDQDNEGVIFLIRPEFFDIPSQMIQGKNVISDFMVNLLRKDNASPQYLLFRLNGQKNIENLIENLISSVLQNDNNNEELIRQYTMGLMFLHLLDCSFSQPQCVTQSQWDTIIGETLKYIDNQYKTAKLNLIAAEFHQTTSAMSKMIKKETGATFQELLIRRRFSQATRLLTETNLRVEEIAVNIGYENLSYFYRQFKQRYGMTPRQYRTIHQRRAINLR